jgi:hypothetical protein
MMVVVEPSGLVTVTLLTTMVEAAELVRGVGATLRPTGETCAE